MGTQKRALPPPAPPLSATLPSGRDTCNIYLSDDKCVVDVTGNHLQDLDIVPLPPTLTELDCTENRLTAIDPRFSELTRLEKLSFRKNLFNDESAAELASCDSLTHLKELVLRDNHLSNVPPLSSFCHLAHLDLSYNAIPSLAGMCAAPPSLLELYLANNVIHTIQDLDHLTNLTLLELGSNQIRVMANLDALTGLQELWLGRNKIRQVALCGLTSLRTLSLQSNRISHMSGLQECLRLEEVYLSNNGIASIEGLEGLVNLRVLDLAANRISRVSGLDTLSKLEDLWVNDNQIASVEAVLEGLKGGPKLSLTTLYIERNPCMLHDPLNVDNTLMMSLSGSWVQTLRAALPRIQQIDSTNF